MDRALKERVIGAVALVAIAVLVVPVFLDGPATDAEIVSEPVTLPGQNEQARKRQTIVLERDRDQPVPATRNSKATTAAEKLAADAAARKAASSESAAQAEAKPPPQATKPEPSREESDQPAASNVAKADVKAEGASTSATESATGMWAVQLGSFSDQANAERLAAELRKNGYAAFLSQLKTSSGSLNRVRVGPQKDRESAEAVASKLGGDGHKGQVVPHP
ncbi:MAG: SPOR domain-containing protein [Woeseia sp.]